MKSLKAIFRRQKDQGQAQAGEDLSRASSISNLNENSKKAGALSKVRKSVSKDRLDNGEKRLDKKGCKNNNHQVELDGAGDEIEGLQKQLEAMTSEKAELVLQLGENRNQLTALEGEIFRLKEQSSVQMEQLSGENAALRNKLRDVVCSPLSDNEKQMLLLDSQRHHSSAPASIATNALNEGDATTCSTPDWDKESCSNVSEVSVACLQDKINQMQETHYSTNEELQATLQELTDLQRQLSELHQDNERLMEEKGLMFQSLCRQTERLNDARDEIDSLKQLLYKEKDTSGQYESVVEREQKLLELLKDSQEEREILMVKLEQRNTEITEVSNLNIQRDKESVQMEERIRTLESTLDAKHAEHKLLDQEMARAKDAASSRQIEIDRLKDLLENARTKIIELEQDRTVSDKSELEELLDNARKEKDLLESEVANLKEQVARGRNEGEKLREQVSILQEEFKVMRNNGKCMQSELEYKVEKLMIEKSQLAEQLQHLDEAAKELQVQAQCHLEDKHQLSSVLSETQRNMSEVERRNVDMETELRHLEKLRAEENEEWDKFQKDLLTSVRVANDFKTEAQQELQKLVLENKTHRDKIRQLEGQLEKLKENVDTFIGGLKNKSKSSSEFEEYLFDTSPVNIVDEQYEKIDKSIPFELLSSEQQFIVKLKRSNDIFLMKQKAQKRHLGSGKSVAISKPLLESVCENPHLKHIVENQQFASVETSFNNESVRDLDPVEAQIVKQTIDGRASDMSEYQDSVLMKHYSSPTEVRRLGVIGKHFNLASLNLEPEELFLNIDENTPEDELDNQGKYILRLKKAITKMGPKVALKKKAFNKKKVVISSPSLESAMSNENLKEIITKFEVKPLRKDNSIKRYKDASKISESVEVEENLAKISPRTDKLRSKIRLGSKAGYNVQEAENVDRLSGDCFESYTKVNIDPRQETFKPLKELKAIQAKEYLRNSLIDVPYVEVLSTQNPKFYDDEYLYESPIYETLGKTNNNYFVEDALDRGGNYSLGPVSDSKITLFSNSESSPKIFKEAGNALSFMTFGKSTPNLLAEFESQPISLGQRTKSDSCLEDPYNEESKCLEQTEKTEHLKLACKQIPQYAVVNKKKKTGFLENLTFSFEPDRYDETVYEEVEFIEERKLSTRNPAFSTSSFHEDNVIKTSDCTKNSQSIKDSPQISEDISIEFKYEENNLESLLDSPNNLFSFSKRKSKPGRLHEEKHKENLKNQIDHSSNFNERFKENSGTDDSLQVMKSAHQIENVEQNETTNDVINNQECTAQYSESIVNMQEQIEFNNELESVTNVDLNNKELDLCIPAQVKLELSSDTLKIDTNDYLTVHEYDLGKSTLDNIAEITTVSLNDGYIEENVNNDDESNDKISNFENYNSDLDEEDLRLIQFARSVSAECDEELTDNDRRLIEYARSVSEIQRKVEDQYFESLEASEIADEVTKEDFQELTTHYKDVLSSLKLKFKSTDDNAVVLRRKSDYMNVDEARQSNRLLRMSDPVRKTPVPTPRSLNCISLTLTCNVGGEMENNVDPQSSDSKDTGAIPKIQSVAKPEIPESIASGTSESPTDLSMENLYESNSSSDDAISSRNVIMDTSFMDMFKKPEDKVYESLSPVKEKRDYFTFTVKPTDEKVAEPVKNSNDKVAALKKRFEESSSHRDENHPHEEPAVKDTLVCGPTFHNINQMAPPPSIVEQKRIDNASYSEVKILDQNLEAAEETEKKHIDIGNSRESFEMAKKIFENNGK